MRRRNTELHARVNGNVAFEFTDAKLTSYAGLELFDRYLRQMGFSKLVRTAFDDARLGGDFGVIAMVRVLIGLLVAGGRRLDHLRYLATDPLLLGVLDQVLGHYQLSAPVGICIGPGEKAQILHRDDAIYPVPEPHPPLVVNTMWPLDEFTEQNGATRFIPGSHRWEPGRRPGPDDPVETAVMSPGSALFYLGSLWHGGGANQTARPRLGVILEYAAGWLRPQENHCLAVPRDIARGLPERLQELLGYNISPPFVGYVDGRHPRRVLSADP